MKKATTSGKTGQNLVDMLTVRARNTGAKVVRADADGFIQFRYNNGTQCATGLKFHVSVQKNDLEKTSLIVDDLVRRGSVADEWKVAAPGMGGDQLGKDFTIYVSPYGYNETAIQGFINNLEQALKRNNIKPNGVGANIISGDKPVLGSYYINYRYDRIDDLGRPMKGYRRNYNFVAPGSEYGGDIMERIRIR